MDRIEHSDTEAGTGTLLLVGDEELTQLVGETLEADGHRCDRAACVREARRRVLESRYDAIVLDLDALAGGALEVVQLASRLAPATVCILRSRSVTIEAVLSAMRAGLGDFLGGTLSVPQVRLRLRAAVRRSRENQQRLTHLARLASNARTLSARDEVSMAPGVDELIEEIPGDGAVGDPPAAAPAPPGSCAPEPIIGDFIDAANQQLDPERLVTAAIEHLVARLGPVNVAVYLGSGTARFGLAAYARADLPRALIEKELALWSDGLCIDAALDGRPSVHLDATRLPARSPTDSSAGPLVDPTDGGHDASEVLSGRGAVVVPCRVDGVCDAVFVIITTAGIWPLDGVASHLGEFGRAFAEQLARIQRIHSRSRHSWPHESD